MKMKFLYNILMILINDPSIENKPQMIKIVTEAVLESINTSKA